MPHRWYCTHYLLICCSSLKIRPRGLVFVSNLQFHPWRFWDRCWSNWYLWCCPQCWPHSFRLFWSDLLNHLSKQHFQQIFPWPIHWMEKRYAFMIFILFLISCGPYLGGTVDPFIFWSEEFCASCSSLRALRMVVKFLARRDWSTWHWMVSARLFSMVTYPNLSIINILQKVIDW